MHCVYRALDFGEADIVAAWLEDHGIPVYVKDRLSAGIYGPLAVAPRGVQVCVVDAETAERAKVLLAERKAATPADPDAADNWNDIEVLCPDCRGVAHFPVADAGSVQSCPHCGAFVDVKASSQPAS